MTTTYNFSEFVGKTIVKAQKGYEGKYEESDNAFLLTFDDDTQLLMFHEQECCESVYIHEINPSLDDIIGGEIIAFYLVTNDKLDPPDYDAGDESEMWSFYKIDTTKGFCTISWFGTSNGYYSIGVDLYKVDKDGNKTIVHATGASLYE